jgi:hypothetical protein
VREVEKMVAGLGPGSRPADERAPDIARHVLRFEVTGEVLATVREALGAFVFCHADGTSYGEKPDAAAADASAKAFQALRGLGFKEREARWALSHVADVGGEASVEEQVRHCLRLLTERCVRVSSAA